MNHKNNLSYRRVVIDDVEYQVPRGIARNSRNRSWQLKVSRAGKVIKTGNFTDDTYNSTQEALSAAIETLEEIPEDPSAEVKRSLKVSDRVTVAWASVGKNVLGLNANIYNPETKKKKTVYLTSFGKLAESTDSIREKLVRAFQQEIRQRVGRETLTMSEVLDATWSTEALMTSERWEEFLKVGAQLAKSAP